MILHAVLVPEGPGGNDNNGCWYNRKAFVQFVTRSACG